MVLVCDSCPWLGGDFLLSFSVCLFKFADFKCLLLRVFLALWISIGLGYYLFAGLYPAASASCGVLK